MPNRSTLIILQFTYLRSRLRGTGSFLVPHLCRLANWFYDAGKQISITLIDFDRIEEKNLYRQNFCQAELGYNKAQALAVRYKAMFPKLKIGAIEDPSIGN